MTPFSRKTPLQKAVSSVRLVGGVFSFLGMIPLLGVLTRGYYEFMSQLLSVATVIILLGPGVWYFVAARLLGRGQFWVVHMIQRVVWVQMAAIVLAFVAGFVGRIGIIATPAILAVFFVPAVIAMIVEIRKASREPLLVEGHGFAVKVLDMADPAAEASSPDGSSDR